MSGFRYVWNVEVTMLGVGWWVATAELETLQATDGCTVPTFTVKHISRGRWSASGWNPVQAREMLWGYLSLVTQKGPAARA